MKRLLYFVPRPRSDLVLWVKSIDQSEFLRDLHIGKDFDDTLYQSILGIIRDN